MTEISNYDDGPTMSDDYVQDKLESFDEVLELHKKFIDSGIDAPEFYPDELDAYLNFDEVERAWAFGSYEILRREYTLAWMRRAEDTSGERLFYSLDDFLEL